MSLAQHCFVLQLRPPESLLIASEFDSLSVMDKLSPYLGGSASIVVHSAFLQVKATLSHTASPLNDVSAL